MSTVRGAVGIALMIIGYWLVPATGIPEVVAAPMFMKVCTIIFTLGCFVTGGALLVYGICKEFLE